MEIHEIFSLGTDSLGIELGSTRIKCCLVSSSGQLLSSGIYEWENKFVDGFWTYSLDEAIHGVGQCYLQMKRAVFDHYGVVVKTIGSIGVSGMMHGLLALDKNGNVLVPFRTWRNNNAEEVAKELSSYLGFNIPARWSLAHLYYSVKKREKYLDRLSSITTIAGYLNQRLCDADCLGLNDASGMFPIGDDGHYDREMEKKIDTLFLKEGSSLRIESLLPPVAAIGTIAGLLTSAGAALLDPEGDLLPGIPLCPPEGDSATGMVATNCIDPKTGNISVGTSVFGSFVLEHPLEKWKPEIDVLTTPTNKPLAMIHCNNCTCGIDAFVDSVRDSLSLFGVSVSDQDLYGKLFKSALNSDKDTGNLLFYNYLSGENITGVKYGTMLLAVAPESHENIPNMMLTQFFSAFASFVLGMRLLSQQKVAIETITVHGGLFKTPVIAQKVLASILNEAIEMNDMASEGGAWGMALLALYIRYRKQMSFPRFLENVVFKDSKKTKEEPDQAIHQKFVAFLSAYEKCLPIEKSLGKEMNAICSSK